MPPATLRRLPAAGGVLHAAAPRHLPPPPRDSHPAAAATAGPLLVVQQLRKEGLLGGKAGDSLVANVTSKVGVCWLCACLLARASVFALRSLGVGQLADSMAGCGMERKGYSHSMGGRCVGSTRTAGWPPARLPCVQMGSLDWTGGSSDAAYRAHRAQQQQPPVLALLHHPGVLPLWRCS